MHMGRMGTGPNHGMKPNGKWTVDGSKRVVVYIRTLCSSFFSTSVFLFFYILLFFFHFPTETLLFLSSFFPPLLFVWSPDGCRFACMRCETDRPITPRKISHTYHVMPCQVMIRYETGVFIILYKSPSCCSSSVFSVFPLNFVCSNRRIGPPSYSCHSSMMRWLSA